MKVDLTFGALARPIADQLIGQGLEFDRVEVDRLQVDADAVTRLYVRGHLSATAAHSARKKIVKAVMKAVR